MGVHQIYGPMFPRMKDILRLALVVLVISISRTEAFVKEDRSEKKGISEVESRQFDGNLGETVNNLTKDYIKGATNPTPEEALRGLFYQYASDFIFRRLFGMSAMDLAFS